VISAGLPSLLQSFFTDRLLRQRRASPHTIAGYRDSFRLLLHFAKERLGKAPSNVTIEDLNVRFVGDFLDDLEKRRKNSARTRNIRLAAVHSFFQYVALEEPAHALLCQQILAMPTKRHERRPVEFLTRAESQAMLSAPDLSSWVGRRDRTMLLLAVQTGLRVSELTGLRCEDLVLGTGAHVHCEGKGRKHRCTPLRPETVKVLEGWLRERRGSPEDPLFVSTRGGKLSRDAIERIVTKYAAAAARTCTSLKRKKVSPHVLRHNTETPITLSHARSIEIPQQQRSEGRQCHQDNQPAPKWLVPLVDDV
jgi:site-specific recombinase XerD